MVRSPGIGLKLAEEYVLAVERGAKAKCAERLPMTCGAEPHRGGLGGAETGENCQ